MNSVVATEADSKTFDVRITSRIYIKFPTVVIVMEFIASGL